MKATTRWINGFSSVVTDNRNHEVIIDMPANKGGRDLGATAFELCLMSYCGCVNTIFNVIAKKMRLNFTVLEVDATGHQDKEVRTFSSVAVELRIHSDASDEKIEKCLQHTLKTCPVGILFHQAGIETSYKIKRVEKAL